MNFGACKKFGAIAFSLAAAFALPSVGQAEGLRESPVSRDAPANSVVAGQELPSLFSMELERSQEFVNQMIARGIEVPVPKDPGGGYTHEQHKLNYKAMYLAGQLYRISGERRYADFVRAMLLEYAELYPTLGDHPARRNQHTGRIFWQVLNDAVWLVHAAQAYNEIRGSLSAADRALIDDDVFRRAAHFLSVDSQVTFDRIHNHATWATAGVGMTGYLLNDRDMIDRALLGSDKTGETGFIRQVELLFSPDGYYAEGPYYQRYALMPFVVFADVIDRNDPERKIFEHRDGILIKAIESTIQQTYRGYFFPFNDAIRDKSLQTEELFHAVAIAYAKTQDPGFLSIANFQKRTVLTDNGFELAKALDEEEVAPFNFRSMFLRDGPDGDWGGVAILRAGEANQFGEPSTAVIAKNTSQGFGHGHFDKLSWQLYDNGEEIVRDYGAARFLNIEAKHGGRYLPENTSWAKSTIAHNTLVVDEQSHFGGNVRVADQHWPRQLYFSDAESLQISSAEIDSAYDGVWFRRTLIMPQIEGLETPLILDLVNVKSEASHQYDLPLHYAGHILEFDFAVESRVSVRPTLGKANGYQHIWVDALGNVADGSGALTWIKSGRFYTYRFASDGPLQLVLGESGANDPEFNLRREPLMLLRANRETGAHFLSIIESHGFYDGAAERTVQSKSRINELVHHRVGEIDIAMLTLNSGHKYAIAISHNPNNQQSHQVTVDGEQLSWTGFAEVIGISREVN